MEKRCTPDVAAALRSGAPVVALESTIVAHGLPWPENLDIGRALEAAVRGAGAVPATIAVLDGEVRVGLSPSELERVAREGRALAKAGAKAILDLPRTLEQLETLGVLVLGYGIDEFPAFYTRGSGLRLEHRVDTPGAVADVLRARWALGLGGVLVANPIAHADELDRRVIEAAIDGACDAAKRDGISGKALTPFLLAELARATAGASVRANRALAIANARLGAG